MTSAVPARAVLYLSGPMTGYPEHNRAAFTQAEEQLLAAGHDVLSPVYAAPHGTTWADYLRADLVLLLRAEAVAVLPDWEASRGARLEVHVAQALGMTVLPVERWLG